MKRLLSIALLVLVCIGASSQTININSDVMITQTGGQNPSSVSCHSNISINLTDSAVTIWSCQIATDLYRVSSYYYDSKGVLHIFISNNKGYEHLSWDQLTNTFGMIPIDKNIYPIVMYMAISVSYIQKP